MKYKKVKVKVTLVQALRLCTDRTARRESRGIVLPFHDHGTRTGEGSASRPGRSLPPGKTRYPLYRRLGGPQSRSGQVRKISPPTGIRSPDRPTRSQSLYRLSYPAHNEIYLLIKYIKSVLWRVAKYLSYIEEARCLKVKCTGRFSLAGKLVFMHTGCCKHKQSCSARKSTERNGEFISVRNYAQPYYTCGKLQL